MTDDLEILDIEEIFSGALYICKSGEHLYAFKVNNHRAEFPPHVIIKHGKTYKIGDKVPYSNGMKEVSAKMRGDKIVYLTVDGKGWDSDG